MLEDHAGAFIDAVQTAALVVSMMAQIYTMRLLRNELRSASRRPEAGAGRAGADDAKSIEQVWSHIHEIEGEAWASIRTTQAGLAAAEPLLMMKAAACRRLESWPLRSARKIRAPRPCRGAQARRALLEGAASDDDGLRPATVRRQLARPDMEGPRRAWATEPSALTRASMISARSTPARFTVSAAIP